MKETKNTLLEKVRTFESEGQAHVAEVEEESRRKLTDILESEEAIVAEYREKAEKKKESIVAEYTQRAQAETASIKEERQQAVQAIHDTAAANRERAIHEIIELLET